MPPCRVRVTDKRRTDRCAFIPGSPVQGSRSTGRLGFALSCILFIIDVGPPADALVLMRSPIDGYGLIMVMPVMMMMMMAYR